MAVNEADLVPGMKFRWLRGHHPGSVEEIVRVQGSQVLVRLLSQGARGVPRGNVGPVGKERVMANAEVVSLPKATPIRDLKYGDALKEAAERMFPPVPKMSEALAPKPSLAVSASGRDDLSEHAEVHVETSDREGGDMSGDMKRTYYPVIDVQDACLARGINAAVLQQAVNGWGIRETGEKLGLTIPQTTRLMQSWGVTGNAQGVVPSGIVYDNEVAAKFTTPLVITKKSEPRPQNRPRIVVRESDGQMIASTPPAAPNTPAPPTPAQSVFGSDVVAENLRRMKADREKVQQDIERELQKLAAMEDGLRVLDYAIEVMERGLTGG